MRILSVAACLVGLAAAPLSAQTQHENTQTAAQNVPVVVELFTSQGCSSCPPADELLTRLAQKEDILALALHVDYWDYIGWKDEFASPAFTRRQKGYAHVGSRRMIYTPQMVIMGYEDVVGANAAAVMDVVSEYRKTPPPVQLQAETSEAEVRLTVTAVQDVEQAVPILVHMVTYEPMQTVSITRGELRGHTIDYANVVEELSVIGTWDGTGEFKVAVPRQTEGKTAFLVQQGSYGRILGALKLD